MAFSFGRPTVIRTTVPYQPGLHSTVTTVTPRVLRPYFTPRYNGWAFPTSTYWYNALYECVPFDDDRESEFQWDPDTIRGWLKYSLHQWKQLPPFQQNFLVGLTSFICGYMVAKRVRRKRRKDPDIIQRGIRPAGRGDGEDHYGNGNPSGDDGDHNDSNDDDDDDDDDGSSKNDGDAAKGDDNEDVSDEEGEDSLDGEDDGNQDDRDGLSGVDKYAGMYGHSPAYRRLRSHSASEANDEQLEHDNGGGIVGSNKAESDVNAEDYERDLNMEDQLLEGTPHQTETDQEAAKAQRQDFTWRTFLNPQLPPPPPPCSSPHQRRSFRLQAQNDQRTRAQHRQEHVLLRRIIGGGDNLKQQRRTLGRQRARH